MKTTAAFLLATLGFATTGCAQKPEEKKPTASPTTPDTACKKNNVPSEPTTVTVFIEYDSAANKATTPYKLARMCEQDTLMWVASVDGDFEDPTFPSGSPFNKPFTHGKGRLKSGNPEPGSAKKSFLYEIKFKVGNNPTVRVDPRVEILE